jgi:hypothetical protein
VKNLDHKVALLLCEGIRPILSKKIRYFNDKQLKKRIRPTPKAACYTVDLKAPQTEKKHGPPNFNHKYRSAVQNQSDADKRKALLNIDALKGVFDYIEVPKSPIDDNDIQAAIAKVLDDFRST